MVFCYWLYCIDVILFGVMPLCVLCYVVICYVLRFAYALCALMMVLT